MKKRVSALYVEPVGGHRGMQYYDFPLCHALAQQGVSLTLATCDETQDPELGGFAVWRPFRRIYGSRAAWLRGLSYLKALGSILRFAALSRPRVAHFSFFLVPWADYVLLRALRVMGVKVVITVHDVVPFDAKAHQNEVFRKLYHLADQIIVHTEASKDELITAMGVPATRAAVVAHGAPAYFTNSRSMPKEEARLALGLSPEAKIILFFGQIKRAKGLDLLLRAFAEVRASFPESRLVIAGPLWKEDFAPYRDCIQHLGLQDSVLVHLHYVPDSEVPIYFHAADAVALPYRRIYQSGVLLMAQSFGRPVVASATGGLAEVIQDGQTGYLVPPDDEHALAATLSKVLADISAAERVGLQGKRWVEREYAWPNLAAQIAQLYYGLLGVGDVQRTET